MPIYKSARFWIASSVVTLATSLGAPSFAAPVKTEVSSSQRAVGVKRVVLITIEGSHALDIQRFINANPQSALAQLSKRAISYTNARATVSDSTPGLIALTTGGSPVSTGVVYSPFYARDLSPPKSDCSTRGTVVYVDEKYNFNPDAEDSGGGLDESKFPRDPARGCAPVKPNQMIRVNSIFDIVKASGGRTAWIDQHIAYNEMAGGMAGDGIMDSVSLEGHVPGLKQSLEMASGQDGRRLNGLLNQIRGYDFWGKNKVGVPTVFGMGFITFGAMQKTEDYADGSGKLTPKVQKALEFVDTSIGRAVDALKAQRLYDSTMIIITAKHAQSPLDPIHRRIVDRNAVRSTVNSVAPGLLAHAALDTIGLIYLKDQSKTAEVAAALRANADVVGAHKIYHGTELQLFMPDPKTDPRMPDIILQPQLGTIYAEDPYGAVSLALRAEHGGMLGDDITVPLIVSAPGLTGVTLKTPVQTAQVAPTILETLGQDPRRLKAVQIEHTPTLPGSAWR